ncbi:uncharacterized protein N7477_005337 [Penicillium maclennaniae]|uniref:uncharacterized protein n=1 Tax=Penicillium maclennaniae TaxID=1343394 RepID=UPI0025415C05|nr:uncharacterized protein N7477_005337 [Penicillium maclennaniae]KAJ5669974.1 hypothetical protein N7477_005337 [Penicillium maclennaniae]
MAGKSKAPQPACVEDFDEVSHDAVPHMTQGILVAPQPPPTAPNLARRAGGAPPVLHKLDMPKHDQVDLARRPSSRKERRDKERARPTRDEKMHTGAYPAAVYHQTHVQRSPSKSRRRDSVRYNEDYHYNYEASPYYHSSTPVETRAMDFPPYFARPPMPDYPPSSPQSARYPPIIAHEEYHTSRPTRSSRSNSHRALYHQDRPVMAQMGPPHMYQPPPPQPMYYEHGPPPSHSAYLPQYSSSPYGGSYYAGSEYAVPTEYVRERSPSRTREPSRPRRSSVYGYPPQAPDDMFDWDDGEFLDQYPSREPQPREPRDSRERRMSKPPVVTQARDEDYYKMPPPPPRAPKVKAAPQIHQKRPPPQKAQTTQAIPRESQRRTSRTLDMGDMAAALPDVVSRRLSREARLPERSHSLRDSKRSTSYHDHARGAQIAVANSRSNRPRPQQYYYEDAGSIDLGDREREVEREVEEYQAQKTGRPATAMPLSTDALIPKLGNGTGSEHGSQKSRSSGSRHSGSKGDGESKNINLEVNGMTIGFTEQGIAGKSINIRTGDSGGVHLNIAGGRKPHQYLTGGSTYSGYTGGSDPRDLESVRRPRERDEPRSERSSRRTSQSTYGRNRRYQAV